MNIENPMILNNWHVMATETETDFFRTSADEYVIDCGEVILKENLDRYLKEQLGFKFENKH
ncbi:YqaI family protein [Bacillus atrophaeus]|uniref:YqaI family protein n=1 Tax=Bacillus atrophaeus TaxID=1452 RepID=UPI002E2504F4|nr:hypothetical protein [Bacillus atrophaeus]